MSLDHTYIPQSGDTEMSHEEFDAREVATVLLDAVATYEQLSGDMFNPSHPNALKELRRVATTKYFMRASWSSLLPAERRIATKVIDRLIAALTVRFATEAAA